MIDSTGLVILALFVWVVYFSICRIIEAWEAWERVRWLKKNMSLDTNQRLDPENRCQLCWESEGHEIQYDTTWLGVKMCNWHAQHISSDKDVARRFAAHIDRKAYEKRADR